MPSMRALTMMLLVAFPLGLAACSDQNNDSVGDAIDDAGDSIGDAADDAGDAINDAGADIQDRLDDAN